MITAEEFAVRRKKLLDQLGPNNAAVLFSSSEKLRNGDVHYPFRQNSTFYYYTGFTEPDTVAFFLPDRKEGEFILFNRGRNEALERWIGPCAGQEGACQIYGANQAFDISQLNEKAVELLLNRSTIFYEIGKKPLWDQKVTSWFSKLQSGNRKGIASPSQLADISILAAEMRLIKNSAEIELLRKAADISAMAHCKLMENCREGSFEFELEALFEYEIKVKGCQSTAYPSIVGGGANACILHYVANNSTLKKNELVLVDAGGEFEYYAADITRTFPVNGVFTKEQSLIYQLVLDAQLAVIEAIRPGLPWNQLQEIAALKLSQGMIELGILKGSLDQVLEKKSYQNYYMHNIGHWLGLDVHDAGSYKINGHWRPLKEGMVLTVEPGLYLSPNNKLASKWWNIGVRIEDDVLVTANGCEVLTHSAPKTIAEIESRMSKQKVTV